MFNSVNLSSLGVKGACSTVLTSPPWVCEGDMFNSVNLSSLGVRKVCTTVIVSLLLSCTERHRTRYREYLCTRPAGTINTRFTVGDEGMLVTVITRFTVGAPSWALGRLFLSSRTFLRIRHLRTDGRLIFPKVQKGGEP